MTQPFAVGDRLDSSELQTWEYKGLSGRPGIDAGACRRFAKGQWIIEVQAHKNPRARSKVISIRTVEADDVHWRETRERQSKGEK